MAQRRASPTSPSGRSDARDFETLLGNYGDSLAAHVAGHAYLSQAEILVRSRWRQIEAVAQAMLEWGWLDGDEVERIVGQ